MLESAVKCFACVVLALGCIHLLYKQDVLQVWQQKQNG